MRSERVTHSGRGGAAAKPLPNKPLSSPPSGGRWVIFGEQSRVNLRERGSASQIQWGMPVRSSAPMDPYLNIKPAVGDPLPPFRHVGYVLHSPGYGLAGLRGGGCPRSRGSPAASSDGATGRPSRSRRTALPSDWQSGQLSEAHTQLHHLAASSGTEISCDQEGAVRGS